MSRALCCCILLVATTAVGVGAQAPQILPARHLDASRVTITLDDFPWRDAAPAAIRGLDGAVPTAARRAELAKMDNPYGIELNFDVTVPGRVRSRHYLLMHADGATPLSVQALVGTGRLDLPEAGQPIRQMVFYGDLRARAANNHQVGGGFVFIGDRPRAATIAPSRHTADELMGAGGTDYFARGTPFWNIVKQFAFTIEGDTARYVFVQWAEDTGMKEGGCGHRYALFRLDAVPVQIASNNYGCDV